MLTLKINWENGDTTCTRINATLEEARDYYVGHVFNLGTVTDDMQKCLSIEVLEANK